MPARVLVLGLDAAEATLLGRWSAEERLPTIASLAQAGCATRLANPLDTLPGAIWPELNTGRSCARMAVFFTQNQLRTGEARLRPVTVEELRPEGYYWYEASRAGCRVAVVDQVHVGRCPDLNGLEVIQWGGHDRSRSYRPDSCPDGLRKEVLARHGDHPVWNSDAYPKTERGFERLLRDLLRGIDRRAALLLDLLGREHWDLFTCTFGESHCVGHQFWRFLDPSHPQHDPRAPQHLRSAILSVYQRIDEAMGRLITAAGPDVTVIAVASHGMGPLVGGPHLVPELLVRMGMGSDGGRSTQSRLRAVENWIKDRVPTHRVPLFERIGRLPLLRQIQEPIGGLVFPLESPRTRAAFIPNNRIGAIRLNLKGREPYGSVAPGTEAEELVAELREEFLALEQPETGERIVAAVMTAEEAFGPGAHRGLPDLLVRFRRDLGPLDACRSRRVGLVRLPAQNARSPRSGDHSGESRLWIAGPGIPAGQRLLDAHVLDLAPTVLARLGVPLPDDLDGRPLSFPRSAIAS